MTTRFALATRSNLAAAVFWVCLLSLPLASVVVITTLAHVLPTSDLPSVSLVFSLSLIGTVIPMGVQSRAATDTAVHGASGRIAVVPAVVATVLLSIVSVPIAQILDVGIPAVVLPSMSLGPAMFVAAIRGDMVGRGDFVGPAKNYLVEGSIRLIGGVGLGIAYGANGVGASLLFCTLGAWLAAPRRHPRSTKLVLPATVAAATTLVLAVNWDVLVAPRLLGSGAPEYVAAALPAKGVYMALSASAWIVIPRVRNRHMFGAMTRPVWLQVAAGCALSLLLVPAAPIIGKALDLSQPSGALLLVLGVGMALASGSWVLLQLRLVVGAASPWVPPLAGLAVVAAVSLTFRSSDGLAAAMLCGGGAGLVVGLVMLAIELRHQHAVAAQHGVGAETDHEPRRTGVALGDESDTAAAVAHEEPESWAEVALASGPAVPYPLLEPVPVPLAALARPVLEAVPISGGPASDAANVTARPALPPPIVATRLPSDRTEESDVARAPTGRLEASLRSGSGAVGPSHSLGPSMTRRCSWLWCTRAGPMRACSWLRWMIRSATTR